MALAQSGQATTFITLTSKPKEGERPADRARQLSCAWRVIVRRARKAFRIKALPYFCVFEATKRGEPHLHILARVKYIPQKWLSKQLEDLTGAPICDIRVVKNKKHVAFYMAKYVGKEPHRFATCKRYWRTRDWDQSDYTPEQEVTIWTDRWYTVDRRQAELRRAWTAKGWDVAMEGDMLVAMTRGPPGPDQGAI